MFGLTLLFFMARSCFVLESTVHKTTSLNIRREVTRLPHTPPHVPLVHVKPKLELSTLYDAFTHSKLVWLEYHRQPSQWAYPPSSVSHAMSQR